MQLNCGFVPAVCISARTLFDLHLKNKNKISLSWNPYPHPKKKNNRQFASGKNNVVVKQFCPG